jgi:hypothetical protein
MISDEKIKEGQKLYDKFKEILEDQDVGITILVLSSFLGQAISMHPDTRHAKKIAEQYVQTTLEGYQEFIKSNKWDDGTRG